MKRGQRTKSDKATMGRRELEDESLRDQRKKNDEITMDRRISADKLLESNRIRNDELTANRRETKDGSFSIALTVFLLMLGSFALGNFLIFS